MTTVTRGNTPSTSIRIAGHLAANLAARGDTPAATIRRDLDRYYTAIESAIREIRLSEPEWNFLRDILNGTFIDETTARMLWAEVADADADAAEKWGVSLNDLSGRIRTMPEFSRLAICDAIERWWRARSHG